MSIKHFICIGLCYYSFCLNGQTKPDTLVVNQSKLDIHEFYHLNASTDQDKCNIEYTDYCRTMALGLDYKAVREINFRDGYLVFTNTQANRKYKLPSSVLHLKWKDPDWVDTTAINTSYSILLSNLWNEPQALFTVKGNEVFIQYPEDKPFWLIKIISENCRQSQLVVVEPVIKSE